MLIVLLATVAFAGVWFVALRPKPDSASGGSAKTSAPDAPGVKGLTNSIAKAKGAVATSQANAAKQARADAAAGGGASTSAAGGTSSAGTSSAAGAAGGTASSSGRSTTGSTSSSGKPAAVRAVAVKTSAATAHAVAAVDRGLARHKVVALLFYNPRSSDDKMVRKSFSHLGTRGGRVVLVAAPLKELSKFGDVTQKVQVTEASSVVIFDRKGQASAIVGFTTDAEMSQRISDALVSRA